MNMKRKATQILLAGFGVNLTIGVLYAWSVFNKMLVTKMGWSPAEASQPYAIAIVVFSGCLLIAGALQDRIGPRKVLILGTTLVGSGMIASSFASSVMGLNMTFGVIVGAGIGFAYACLAPAAMKWFHPSKKGMVNGIIASGFGLGAVYIAPLASHLLEAFGPQKAFIILGVCNFLVSVPLAATISNPPKDYTPAAPNAGADDNAAAAAAPAPTRQLNWRQMMKTPQFYTLWLMFALASSVGLVIIGNITTIASVQANLPNAVYLASLLAIFNSGGRVGAGILSDKIGCIRTLQVAFVAQGINMVLFASYQTELTLMIGTAVAAVCYGALLSVFPSVTAEYYGLKNYGANYGVLYTAWGIAGPISAVVLSIAMGFSDGGYGVAYVMSATMIAVCLGLSFLTRPMKEAATYKLATNEA